MSAKSYPPVPHPFQLCMHGCIPAPVKNIRKKADDACKLRMEASRKAEACPSILCSLSASSRHAPGPDESTSTVLTLVALRSCHLATGVVILSVPSLGHLVLAGFSMLESGFRDPSGCRPSALCWFRRCGLRMSYEAGLAVVGFSMSALAWFRCAMVCYTPFVLA
jgi:hypothetical protein